MSIRFYFIASLAALCLTGCQETQVGQSKPAEVQPPAEPPIFKLLGQVHEFSQKDQTNEAFRVLEAAFKDPVYAESKQPLLTEYIRFSLWAGRPDLAKDRFLSVASEDLDTAAGVLGMIENNLLQSRKYEELVAWCNTTKAFKFPGAGRAGVFWFQFQAYRALGAMNSVQELLPVVFKELPEDQSTTLVSRFMDSLMAYKMYQELDTVMQFLTEKFPKQPGLADVIVMKRFWSFLNQEMLEKAADVLQVAVDTIPENQVQMALDQFLAMSVKWGKKDLATEWCKKILDKKPADSGLFAVAARSWVKTAAEGGDAKLVLERLNALHDKHIPDPALLQLLKGTFYLLLDKGDQDTRAAAMKLCESLQASAKSDAEKETLAGMMLDGSFMMQDYERALKIVNAGIPGMTDATRDTLVPKIEAHIALVAGNKDEAIKKFRLFMDMVAKGDETVTDPVTNARVSREYILGLNASRIGEIWASKGIADQAAAVRQEARDHFEKALSKAKQGSPEYKLIQKEMTKLSAPASSEEKK
jgi:tetratricopeptide (TPR) repeat protein